MHHVTKMGPQSRRRFLETTGGLVTLAIAPACTALRQPSRLSSRIIPDPREVGKRVAGYTAAHQLDRVDYPTVCCAYGLLLFAQASGDRVLEERVETVYAAYLSGEKDPARDTNGRKVEHRWFGIIPLQLGVARNPHYRTVAQTQADLQEAEPAEDSDVRHRHVRLCLGHWPERKMAARKAVPPSGGMWLASVGRFC